MTQNTILIVWKNIMKNYVLCHIRAVSYTHLDVYKRQLRDRYGLNFPTDGITISTVGPVDQLKKLREEHLKRCV